MKKDNDRPAVVRPEADGTVTELSAQKGAVEEPVEDGKKEETSGNTYLVRTGAGRSLVGEGFPTVSSSGVIMNEEEKSAAQEAAASNGVALHVTKEG